MGSGTRTNNSTLPPRAINAPLAATKAGLPPVLASAPLQEYRDGLAAHVAWLSQKTPSDSLTEFAVSMLADIDAAFERAAHTELWISVDEAVRLSGMPRSTITSLCRKYPDELGAKKQRAKAWSIHLPTFSQYLNHRT